MSHISPASKQEKFSSALSALAESGKSAEESVKIEQSILKTYRKRIWNPFIGALKDYAMIEEGDRIAVCISGGKDSMLLAKCMQHLQCKIVCRRHLFDIFFILFLKRLICLIIFHKLFLSESESAARSIVYNGIFTEK